MNIRKPIFKFAAALTICTAAVTLAACGGSSGAADNDSGTAAAADAVSALNHDAAEYSADINISNLKVCLNPDNAHYDTINKFMPYMDRLGYIFGLDETSIVMNEEYMISLPAIRASEVKNEPDALAVIYDTAFTDEDLNKGIDMFAEYMVSVSALSNDIDKLETIGRSDRYGYNIYLKNTDTSISVYNHGDGICWLLFSSEYFEAGEVKTNQSYGQSAQGSEYCNEPDLISEWIEEYTGESLRNVADAYYNGTGVIRNYDAAERYYAWSRALQAAQ